MRIVLAHDYLTQRGGGERVALEMMKAFPGSPMVTSMFVPETTFPEFSRQPVQSLGLDRFPPFADAPQLALPLVGEVFRRRTVDADVLLCSSSGFSHQLRTTGVKIVYCHNPPRWLYQWQDYSMGLGAPVRTLFPLLRRHLLHRDREGARSVTAYIANSANVAGRIRRAYGVTPRVLHPPRGLTPEGPVEPVPGIRPGFLLTVGRLRGYKRTDLLLQAVAEMPDVTLVTVGSQPDSVRADNIHHLRNLSDAHLRWLYRSSSGLLACSREDFGLTPVEAFGFGIPVAATPEGGYLETCQEGLTGSWLDASSPAALRGSIRDFLARSWDRRAIQAHGTRWAGATFRDSLRTIVADVLAEVRGGSPTPPA